MRDAKIRKSPYNLTELATRFFKKEGYIIKKREITLEGFSGLPRKFDLIVQKGRTPQGVWIRDWNRTIGVNVIIGLDKASEDVNLFNPILIGEKFSDHAKSYANRRKTILLTKRQIVYSLRQIR